MDQVSFDEIVSILARNGRPDLIVEFTENVKVDEDYKPPSFLKREKYSDDEGSAATEEEYSVSEDEEGFMSLK